MADARRLLPLNTLVFETLLALTSETRHGWDLVREIQQRLGGERVLPANFYRTLRGMLADGLIVESDPPKDKSAEADRDERRRYFTLTTLGREVARLEARRLETLVAESRAKNLLRAKR
jgi:DNA-binding PadR family transcriptional regulator